MNGGFRDRKNNCLAVEKTILHHESIRGCDPWITSPDAHEEVAPQPERFEDRNDVLLAKCMVLRSVTQKDLSFEEGSAMLLDVLLDREVRSTILAIFMFNRLDEILDRIWSIKGAQVEHSVPKVSELVINKVVVKLTAFHLLKYHRFNILVICRMKFQASNN
jgi:hypothetical protein